MPVPADAKAVIVAQNLVAARYVQLTPAYRKGGGPTMRDGAVIPSDRTAVPVEWDEVKTQLMRLATELGPKTGVSGTSVSRFIDSAANALDGNGDKLRQTLAQLSGAARIFAEGSGNIVDIIKNLQTFVTALRDSKEQIVMFENRLASLTSVVNDNRSDLDAALSDLSVALGEVQRFVAGSRNQTSEQIQQPCRASPRTWSTTASAVENILHITPNAIANYQNIYYPPCRRSDRSVLARQLREPGLVLLRPDRRRREHHRARNGETLRAISRSRACDLLNFNNLPFPINPYLRPALEPGKDIIYTDPKLAPGGAGPGDAPEPPPTVSAYTGVGDDRRRRPGLGTATGTAGTVSASGEVPAIPSPALFPGAPIPGPPTMHPGTVAVADRRRHAAPGDGGAGRPPPPPGATAASRREAAIVIRAAHARSRCLTGAIDCRRLVPCAGADRLLPSRA